MDAMVCPLPAPPPPLTAEAACEHRKDVAQLMRGLARGLEELLGAKPTPPAPKIVCPRGPAEQVDRANIVALIGPAVARTDASRDSRPRGQVVQLPVRPRQRILSASANCLTEARTVRL
jgi:hypothetical protein